GLPQVPLVEVESGLLAGDDIGLELHTEFGEGNGSIEAAMQYAGGLVDFFLAARGEIGAFDDGARLEEVDQGGHDIGFQAVNARDRGLDDKHIGVAVDDETGD